jgi:hypothetical protein
MINKEEAKREYQRQWKARKAKEIKDFLKSLFGEDDMTPAKYKRLDSFYGGYVQYYFEKRDGTIDTGRIMQKLDDKAPVIGLAVYDE